LKLEITYVVINSVLSVRKHITTIIKVSLLTIYREIVSVYTKYHTKPINTKYRISDVKAGGMYIGTGL
jgi:hypothetical protein